MARARAAFQPFAQALHDDRGAEVVRVNLRRRWGEEAIHGDAFECRAVLFHPPRILFQVFSRAELLGIDEDRDYDRRALLPRRAHQREMAFMQRAHRGDEPCDASLAARFARHLLHPFDSVDRFHSTRQAEAQATAWLARSE